MLVTAATLGGGCGDGSPEQAALQNAQAEGPGAIVARAAPFGCRPWNRRSGGCGDLAQASSPGGAAGAASSGAGGTAGAPGGGQDPGAPFPIATPASSPIGVSTDGTTVAWVEPTAVRSCPVTGCPTGTPAPLNATPLTDTVAGAVALDPSSVYWLSSTQIQRCGRNGCADNEVLAALPGNAVGAWRELAVRDGTVYADTKTMVYECPATGCDQTPTAVFGRPDDLYGTPFAVDETGLFVTITGEGYGTYYCPAGNCPAAIGSPLATPGGLRLAAASGTVFMWDFSNDITSCSGTGCPGGATTLAAGQTTLTSMAADASGVYWTTSDGTTGAVWKCALPACAGGPLALASNQANPVSVAVGEHYVVWANQGGPSGVGSIMGLAK